MEQKKVSGAVKRRLLLFGSISVFIILYFVFISISYTYQYINLYNKKSLLEKDLYALKEKESSLKIELQKLNNPEYIARYARENYLYSKDGEYIIKIDKKDDQETEEKDISNYNNYYISILVITFFISFFLIKKGNKKNHEN